MPFVVWWLTGLLRGRRQCRDAAEKLGSGGLCLGGRYTSYATTWTSAPFLPGRKSSSHRRVWRGAVSACSHPVWGCSRMGKLQLLILVYTAQILVKNIVAHYQHSMQTRERFFLFFPLATPMGLRHWSLWHGCAYVKQYTFKQELILSCTFIPWLPILGRYCNISNAFMVIQLWWSVTSDLRMPWVASI